jgi:hypothetical protein
MLKTPYFRKYKFKKSYGGAPEPQTPQDAPWLHGPSLKRPQSFRTYAEPHHESGSEIR